MAYTTQYSGYVKFLRGTPAAYSAITKDADTLYFISEPNAASGLLYLGNKLISGSVSSATSLSDLQDILIGAGLTSNSLLVYDATQQAWVNKPVSEVLNVVVAEMQGATASTNGTSGLVPAPQAGEQNLYLQGDGSWSDPTASLSATVSVLVSDVSDLSDDIAALRGNDTTGTIRQIAANEVAGIVANAPAEFDTLKEIADWISNHRDALDIAQLEDDVADLQAVVFDVVEVVDPDTQEVITPASDGLVTRVGNLETAMQTATGDISSLQSVTTTLVTDVADLKDDVDDLQSDFADLDNRLRWQNLVNQE